jgi:hypothetical protein
MVSDAGGGATDGGAPDERPVETGDARGTGSPLVDRWTELDRGWRALALGLGIVAAHAAGQLAGVF